MGDVVEYFSVPSKQKLCEKKGFSFRPQRGILIASNFWCYGNFEADQKDSFFKRQVTMHPLKIIPFLVI